jgi:hypothetical protein
MFAVDVRWNAGDAAPGQSRATGGSHAAPPLDLSVNHSVDQGIWPLEPGQPYRMMRLMKPTQLSPGQLLGDGDSCDDFMNVARGTRGASVMSSSNGIQEGNLK